MLQRVRFCSDRGRSSETHSKYQKIGLALVCTLFAFLTPMSAIGAGAYQSIYQVYQQTDNVLSAATIAVKLLRKEHPEVHPPIKIEPRPARGWIIQCQKDPESSQKNSFNDWIVPGF